MLTETAARQQAKELNAKGAPTGTVYVAWAVPVNSWSSRISGWSVALVKTSPTTRSDPPLLSKPGPY